MTKTASSPTKDQEKLVLMSNEEVKSFLVEYEEKIWLSINNDVDLYLNEMEPREKKAAELKAEWKRIDSSGIFTREAKNRSKAQIDQDLMLLDEEIKTFLGKIKNLNDNRKFLGPKFLRPLLKGLLEEKFCRFEFMLSGDFCVIAGWTRFVEIEILKPYPAAPKNELTSYLMGRYRVEIALLRADPQIPIKIFNLDSLSTTNFPHPHINENFMPCFGDFHLPIQNLLQRKQYLLAFSMLYNFLSSYSLNRPQNILRHDRRPYGGALIEYRPKKGDVSGPIKPPDKINSNYYCDE